MPILRLVSAWRRLPLGAVLLLLARPRPDRPPASTSQVPATVRIPGSGALFRQLDRPRPYDPRSTFGTRCPWCTSAVAAMRPSGLPVALRGRRGDRRGTGVRDGVRPQAASGGRKPPGVAPADGPGGRRARGKAEGTRGADGVPRTTDREDARRIAPGAGRGGGSCWRMPSASWRPSCRSWPAIRPPAVIDAMTGGKRGPRVLVALDDLFQGVSGRRRSGSA